MGEVNTPSEARGAEFLATKNRRTCRKDSALELELQLELNLKLRWLTKVLR